MDEQARRDLAESFWAKALVTTAYPVDPKFLALMQGAGLNIDPVVRGTPFVVVKGNTKGEFRAFQGTLNGEPDVEFVGAHALFVNSFNPEDWSND